jgi:hypothetical protein
MTGTAWTEHIKDFAAKRGVSYGAALKMPECKAAYHEGKGKGLVEPVVVEEKKKRGRPKTKDNIQLTIKEKTARGRPKKYATEEEAKAAKSAKSIESNKRRAVAKKALKGGKIAEPQEEIDKRKPLAKKAREAAAAAAIQREHEARQRAELAVFQTARNPVMPGPFPQMGGAGAKISAVVAPDTTAPPKKRVVIPKAKIAPVPKKPKLAGKGGRSSKVAIEPEPEPASTAVANPLDIQSRMENKAALAIKRKADKAATTKGAKKASATLTEFKSLRDAYFQNPTSTHLKQAYLAMRTEKGIRDDNSAFPIEPPSASGTGLKKSKMKGGRAPGLPPQKVKATATYFHLTPLQHRINQLANRHDQILQMPSIYDRHEALFQLLEEYNTYAATLTDAEDGGVVTNLLDLLDEYQNEFEDLAEQIEIDQQPQGQLAIQNPAHMGGAGLALTPCGGKIYPLTMGHITQMLKSRTL